MDATWVSEAPANPGRTQRLSWLAPFHPFLALDVALNRIKAPDITAVASYGPIGKYLAAYPAGTYILTTLSCSVLLTMLSMFFVRRCTKLGEQSLLGRLKPAFRKRNNQRKTRKPHQVWANPVAWREAVTRASATSRGMGRYLVIGCGLIGALWLLVYYLKGWAGFNPSETRTWLAVIIAIEFALVLIIATNTAASSLTKEKESKTMDLLLATPLSSSYLIWGKLRGLVSFVLPLIAVPVISLLIFGITDEIRRPAERAVYWETGMEIGSLMIIFSAYACMLGLHFSLKQRRTVKAVLLAVAVLIGANTAIFLFWNMIVEGASVLGPALAAATPFTSIQYMIDPSSIVESQAAYLQKIGSLRLSAFIGSAIFITLHAIVVFSWYKAMVRSFDMIIRKQSGL